MEDLIKSAFREVDRKNFVSNKYQDQADSDIPLPIGFGQTISQPTTVRMMLEWLDAQPGDKVLDVGSGSGFTSALLAEIVDRKGKVYAVERIPELEELGKKNCEDLDIKNIQFYLADKRIYGLPKFAPYDRILVSASADKLPHELISQLKVNGKMVIPVGNSVLEVKKINDSDIEIIEHYGFVFVPLIEN